MSPFELLLAIYGVVLALAGLAVVYRMIVGPTILDRAISSDSLVTLVVMGMALYVAHSKAAWAGPAMLGLTGLAFIGTVTFARFVAREDPSQGRRRRDAAEPSTDTGPHEAIHPGPAADGSAWPDNTYAAAAEGPDAVAGGQDAALEEEGVELEDPVEDPEHPGEPLPSPVSEDDAAEGGGSRTAGTAGTADTADDGEQGFGARPGSRGFEDDPWSPGAGGRTEGPR